MNNIDIEPDDGIKTEPMLFEMTEEEIQLEKIGKILNLIAAVEKDIARLDARADEKRLLLESLHTMLEAEKK